MHLAVLDDHWSFDAAVGYAEHKGLFMRNEMVCATTLYNYLHKGVLGIKAIDLPLVVGVPNENLLLENISEN